MVTKRLLNQPIGARFLHNGQALMKTDLNFNKDIYCVDLDTGYMCILKYNTMITVTQVCNREA